MANPVKAGVPIIGVIFLSLAAFKFFTGGGWIVWLILGALFGGFGIFSANRSQGTK